MDRRIQLHKELVTILGTRNVYFQPPETIKIVYPAIIYSRTSMPSKYANNLVYNNRVAYEIIVVDSNPDSTIVKSMSMFKTVRHIRNYKKNELNHDVFSLVY